MGVFTARIYKHGKNDEQKTRVAAARVISFKTIESHPDSRIMFQSGTTSKVTPFPQNIEEEESCNVQILLGDELAVPSKVTGTRKVSLASESGVTKASLSNTIAAQNLAMSLLSVPALTAKGILAFVCSHESPNY